MILGGFFSPLSQYKGREILKDSNIDFFTSLIKEGKFINAVDGLTIFIKKKMMMKLLRIFSSMTPQKKIQRQE